MFNKSLIYGILRRLQKYRLFFTMTQGILNCYKMPEQNSTKTGDNLKVNDIELVEKMLLSGIVKYNWGQFDGALT